METPNKAANLPEWFEQKDHDVANKRYYGRAPLKYFLHHEVIKGFRAAKSYGVDDLQSLTQSLIGDGGKDPVLLNPLHAVFSGEVLSVLSGNRRLAAMKSLAGKEDSKITDEVMIPVYVYEDVTEKEVIAKAVTDNAHRKQLSDPELMHTIAKMHATGFNESEIEAATGISNSKLGRFMTILQVPVLKQFLEDNVLPYSTLARLGEQCKDKPKMQEKLKEVLDPWKEDVEAQIKDAKEKRERDGKTLNDGEKRHSSYLKAGYIEGRGKEKKDGKMPTGKAGRVVATKPEVSEKRVKIGSYSVKPTEVTVEDLTRSGVRFRDAGEALIALAKSLKSQTVGADEDDEDQRVAELLGKTSAPEESQEASPEASPDEPAEASA